MLYNTYLVVEQVKSRGFKSVKMIVYDILREQELLTVIPDIDQITAEGVGEDDLKKKLLDLILPEPL